MSRADRRVRAVRRAPTTSARQLPLPLRRERVLRAIARLPEDQRVLLALCVVEGLTPAETASITGLSSRQVTAAFERLLMVLRRALHAPSRRSGALPRPTGDGLARRAV